MFDHRHYVPVLKGKRAEFAALGGLKARERLTPLIEAVPSQSADFAIEQMAKAGWPRGERYLLDLMYLDDDEVEAADQPITHAFNAVAAHRHTVVPVTGTARSPEYQAAVQAIVAQQRLGVAVRLVPEDFEESDVEDALTALTELLEIAPSQVDLVVDLQSIAGQGASAVAQMHRANIALLPSLSAWRTLTVVAGAFPLGLGELARDNWNRAPRTDWRGWSNLVSGSRQPERLPSYGDYAIAHPGLPPEGQATILAQLRYTLANEFMIWKGRNAIREGFEQFNAICRELARLPDFRGAAFSAGDRMIHEKATTDDSPGNAQVWRRIGTNHHIEMVLEQLSSRP